jgi:HEAT repeat protein
MLTKGDSETSESGRYALSSAREWISKPGSIATDSTQWTSASEMLLGKFQVAYGQDLVELALTLAALPAPLSIEVCERALRSSPVADTAENVIARLYLLERLDLAIAIREARIAQRHSDASVRLCAVELIARNISFAGGFSLIQHSTDESTAVRRASVRAIGRAEPSDEVLRMLRASLADSDVWVRAEAIKSLGALFAGSADVLPDLIDSLSNPHPLCRLAAVRALVDYTAAPGLSDEPNKDGLQGESPVWYELLQIALRDSQAEVRRGAIMAFLTCPDIKLAQRVASTTLKDENWSIQYAAVELLATLRTRHATKLLVRLASNGTVRPAVRGAAIRALADQGDSRACDFVSIALSSGDETLIEDGFNALLLLARHQKQALKDLISDGAPRIANIVRYVLETEGGSSV